MPSATINAPYPNRITLDCAPLIGPFVSETLGNFDCTRDVRVYLNGDLLESRHSRSTRTTTAI